MAVEQSTGQECELELFWRQTAPDEWVARLTDAQTGERREARSEPELRTVLDHFLAEGRAGPAAARPADGTADAG